MKSDLGQVFSESLHKDRGNLKSWRFFLIAFSQDQGNFFSSIHDRNFIETNILFEIFIHIFMILTNYGFDEISQISLIWNIDSLNFRGLN